MADDLDVRDALEALLREAGSIWDVRDRDDEWRLEASFMVEQHAPPAART
ncbi:hypothetical protein M446_3972 [Methylobacterium sp. 4-46]|nr:hypothetical protein [Methylobacterium sp. 4-46]ACA18338.1 hypothetical protein M446_3972 [Methylobacterium sp. 4-46]